MHIHTQRNKITTTHKFREMATIHKLDFSLANDAVLFKVEGVSVAHVSDMYSISGTALEPNYMFDSTVSSRAERGVISVVSRTDLYEPVVVSSALGDVLRYLRYIAHNKHKPVVVGFDDIAGDTVSNTPYPKHRTIEYLICLMTHADLWLVNGLVDIVSTYLVENLLTEENIAKLYQHDPVMRAMRKLSLTLIDRVTWSLDAQYMRDMYQKHRLEVDMPQNINAFMNRIGIRRLSEKVMPVVFNQHTALISDALSYINDNGKVTGTLGDMESGSEIYNYQYRDGDVLALIVPIHLVSELILETMPLASRSLLVDCEFLVLSVMRPESRKDVDSGVPYYRSGVLSAPAVTPLVSDLLMRNAKFITSLVQEEDSETESIGPFHAYISSKFNAKVTTILRELFRETGSTHSNVDAKLSTKNRGRNLKERRCDNCGKMSFVTYRCSNCKKGVYCSQECYAKNWQAHSKSCVSPRTP